MNAEPLHEGKNTFLNGNKLNLLMYGIQIEAQRICFESITSIY